MKACGLIPAWNEEKTIQEIILRLKKIGLKAVVVDDGSEDRTSQLARQAGAEVVRHKINKGKGESIKTGLAYLLKRHPELKYVVLLDADMQYDPIDAVKFLKPLESGNADFVVGYRDWKTVPFRHGLGNYVWKTVFNLFFGTDFKDTNCGFISMTRKVMENMEKVLHGGYIIENTMLVEAIKNNLKIKQVPVSVTYKAKSGIKRGIRIVVGILIFIITQGITHQFDRLKRLKI